MLSAIPTFADFDGDLPQTEFRYEFLERVIEDGKRTDLNCEENLDNGGPNVGRACVSEIVSFLNRPMAWMTSTYNKLHSPGATVDNWKYVCHCV